MSHANRIPPKPAKDSGFQKPVAWLIGRQLIGSLKWIALYSAYKGKLDARDWMNPTVNEITIPSEQQEFWFDYLADTGDGQKAMYSVAYLCMADLWMSDNPTTGARVRKEVTFHETAERNIRLPRGEFLFVGGDTSYQIADYPTLAKRFQNPFWWAYRDLQKQRLVDERSRPIFGIPGNHDYYDQLDGFNRQFRRPCTPEGMENLRGHPPLLSLPTFERRQQASYVALALPFGWWFWGVDTENNKVDTRQEAFFRSLRPRQPGEFVNGTPRKLLIAMPEPTTAYGQYSDDECDLTRTWEGLGLDLPFLRRSAGTLDHSKCRLDLSGNVHYYARYWGPPLKDNYASVVAGLGGAFLHPTETDLNEVETTCLYPSKKVSRIEVAKNLLNPWRIMQGGGVWVVGGLSAMIVYLAATALESTRTLIDWFLLLLRSESHPLNLELLQPLSASFYMILAVLCSGAALGFAIWYPSRIFRKAYTGTVNAIDYMPVFLMVLAAVILLSISIWKVGIYPARQVIGYITFLTVVLGITFGSAIAAWRVGGVLHGRLGKAGFALLGFWHGMLHLGVPLLLVRSGNPWTFFMAALCIAIFTMIGYVLMKNGFRWLFLSTWIVYGALMLYIPIMSNTTFLAVTCVFNCISWWGYLILAGLIGAMLSCIWLGWYFAVSLAFHGHNNEAGGAARIERFKQFIRFRITENDVTGYVIGIDDPQIDGTKLRPKIVDIFQLTIR